MQRYSRKESSGPTNSCKQSLEELQGMLDFLKDSHGTSGCVFNLWLNVGVLPHHN